MTPSATCRRTSWSPVAAGEVAAHHVIDRAPTVVTDPGPEPVDERVFNPIGFRKDWDHPVVDLARISGRTGHRGRRRRPRAASRACASPPTPRPPTCWRSRSRASRVVTEGVLDVAPAARRRARRAGRPRRRAAPRGAQRRRAPRRLRPPLHARLALGAGLARRRTPRRACLRSARCWRPCAPTCSTSRCGRSPASGARRSSWCWPRTASSPTATPYAGARRPAAPGAAPSTESTFFGDVLTAASRAASSDVLLKVDDDDWYSPDAVHDLLMARRFSGADVVGMPSEFVYLDDASAGPHRAPQAPLRDLRPLRGRRHAAARPRHCCARSATSDGCASSSTRSCSPGSRRRRPDLPHPRPRLRPAPHRRGTHLAPRRRVVPPT